MFFWRRDCTSDDTSSCQKLSVSRAELASSKITVPMLFLKLSMIDFMSSLGTIDGRNGSTSEVLVS